MPLHVHSTLTRTKVPFQPAHPKVVRIYTCGLTVYAPMHIGHEDRYRQPCHCFRKGFVSELVRAGATEKAVRQLVGHSGGVTFDVYTSQWAMEEALSEAVGLIPAIAPPKASTVVSLKADGVPVGSDRQITNPGGGRP